MNAINVLKKNLEKYENIRTVLFHEYPPQRLLQQAFSDWTTGEMQSFEFALQLKKKYHFLFWDGIMLSQFYNPHHSRRMLEAALHHNPIKEVIRISRKNFLEKCDDLIRKHPRIAVCSKVIMTDGSIQHIPMIDFHIPVADENLPVVIDCCKALGLHCGFILNSGESYHFIGTELMPWENIYRLLTRSLIFSPIIDKAWISHQLQEKNCSLRINKKHNIYPTVIEQL